MNTRHQSKPGNATTLNQHSYSCNLERELWYVDLRPKNKNVPFPSSSHKGIWTIPLLIVLTLWCAALLP